MYTDVYVEAIEDWLQGMGGWIGCWNNIGVFEMVYTERPMDKWENSIGPLLCSWSIDNFGAPLNVIEI